MQKDDLKERHRRFAIRIVKLVDAMPNTIASKAIAHQIIRSGTSPAANYRAACLAKSDKDFLNKLKIVQEEIDETSFWLGLIIDAEILPQNIVQGLYEESIELMKITTKSIITTKERLNSEDRYRLNG